eukprot:8595153-Pyramimonas_sp.AAC.1
MFCVPVRSDLNIDQFNDAEFNASFREEFVFRAKSLAESVMRGVEDWEVGLEWSDVTVRITGDIVAGSVVVPAEVSASGECAM